MPSCSGAKRERNNTRHREVEIADQTETRLFLTRLHYSNHKYMQQQRTHRKLLDKGSYTIQHVESTRELIIVNRLYRLEKLD